MATIKRERGRETRSEGSRQSHNLTQSTRRRPKRLLLLLYEIPGGKGLVFKEILGIKRMNCRVGL